LCYREKTVSFRGAKNLSTFSVDNMWKTVWITVESGMALRDFHFLPIFSPHTVTY
jgi:hypothetical protein